MREITSAENPRFRSLLKLQRSTRERRRAGLILLEGAHLVESYVQHAGAPDALIVSRSAAARPEVEALFERAGAGERLVLADGLFRALSSLATPAGIIAIAPAPRPLAPPRVPGACIMLEDVQDPGNLGSIVRSAAAAGINELYLSRGCVQAWSPRVLRAGMGAHFLVEIYEGVELTDVIERCAGPVLALALHGTPLYAADLTAEVALVFGSEGTGLSAPVKDAADAVLTIPMPGNAESLNVAAAVAVCVFERVRQRAR